MSNINPLPGPVRVRFAPSPTGTLHVGSARTALYNYLYARHMKGSFILRIEDSDVSRSTHEFEESIIADLRWLGLDWDEGPDSSSDYGPYRQSERSDEGIYRRAAERLLNENKAYYCFCSQGRLDSLKDKCLKNGEMPKYDRRCAGIDSSEAAKRLADGEPATIRFQVPDVEQIVVHDMIHGDTKFSSDVLGDFIILRSDGGVSYNFAVVVDDIAMGITHVIRGEDHLTNAARQILIFTSLGHEPPAFAHHSLIMGPDGGKLSKRHGATSVGDFRKMGYLSGAIINYLALLSWSPEGDEEKLSRVSLEKQFELHRVSKSPAIFDIQKLNWLNGLHIRDLDRKEFHEAILPFINETPSGITRGQMAIAEVAVQTSLVTLAEAETHMNQFFVIDPWQQTELAEEMKDPQSSQAINFVLQDIEDLKLGNELDESKLDDELAAAKQLLKKLKGACKENDVPAKKLFRSLRIALTGRSSGPELSFLLPGLGRQLVRERLEQALKFAAKP